MYNDVYMKKVLITGGMGFIGKFLTRKILRDTDYQIIIVDSLVAGVEKDEIISHDRVTFIQSDLDHWQSPVGELYDQIYHLASPVGPVRVLKFAGRMSGIIVSHLEKMANIAIATKAKLMFMSTSELYGFHALEPTKEDVDKIVSPKITVRLEYAMAKLMGEILLHNLAISNDLSYLCIRPFNIVGPEQNHKGGFVIPRFLQLASKNEAITVYGDGKMKRTFTHIDDFIEGIFLLMESEYKNDIYNVGTPDNVISILDLAQKIKAAMNSQSKINLVDPKTLYGDAFEEAYDKIPNVDKLVAAVGWKPKWLMEDIIKQTVELEKDYLFDS